MDGQPAAAMSGVAARLLAIADRPRVLAVSFGLQAMLVVLLLAVLVPPFENSDEVNHFERADQISRLELVATRYAGPGNAGGTTDPGIGRIDAIVGTVRFHPERKVSGAMLQQAGAIGWHGGARLSFPNTAIYTPLLYLPTLPALWLGKALRLPIAGTLVLARIAEGTCSVLVASLAIAAAGEAALLLVLLLSLPMSLSLMASVSQDGPMLALAAATVGLVRLMRDGPRFARRGLPLLCACLLLLGLGRPTYAAFAVLPLLSPRNGRRAGPLGSAFVLAGIGAWSLLTLWLTMPRGDGDRGVAPLAQLSELVSHPQRLAPLLWRTFQGPQGMEGEPYWHELVGVLGWIDTRLPGWFYPLAAAVLVLAAATTVARVRPLLRPASQGVMAASALCATGLVFLLEYLTWSPLGAPFVDGVQGRYFLPVLLMLPLFLPALGWPQLDRRLRPLRASLLLFPTLSALVTVVVVVRRYYL